MDRRGGGGTSRVVLRLTSEAATRPNRGTQHAQHNPRTLITQTLEGGARGVDEGDGKFFFCFLAKETETRMKTRSVEMFSHARFYFPVYNKRGITLCITMPGCLRAIAKAYFQGCPGGFNRNTKETSSCSDVFPRIIVLGTCTGTSIYPLPAT